MYRPISYRKLYESVSESYPFISQELIDDFPGISERIIEYFTEDQWGMGRVARDFSALKKSGIEYAYFDYHQDPSGDCFLCIRIGDKVLPFRIFKITEEEQPGYKLRRYKGSNIPEYLAKNFKGSPVDGGNKDILRIAEEESVNVKEFLDSIFSTGSEIDKGRFFKATRDSNYKEFLRVIVERKNYPVENYIAFALDTRYAPYYRNDQEAEESAKFSYWRTIVEIITAINRDLLISKSSVITRESIFALPKWKELESIGWNYSPSEVQWKNGNINIGNPDLPIPNVIIFSNGYVRPAGGNSVSPLKRFEPITTLDDWSQRLEYADQYGTRAFCKKIGFPYKNGTGMKEMTKNILSSRKVTVDQILELAKFNLPALLGSESESLNAMGKFAEFISVTGNMAI